MKKIYLSIFSCLAALMAVAADAPWTPDMTGKEYLSKDTDESVITGRSDIVETPEGAAFKFLAGRKPAVFNGTGILNDGEGTIDFFIKYDFPEKFDQHTNTLFKTEGLHIGFNTAADGKTAIFAFATAKNGKKYTVYKNVKLTSGKWHRITLRWASNSIDIWLDGAFVQQSGFGNFEFTADSKAFQIGEWDWGHCRALIRDFRIYKKAHVPGAIKVTPVQKKNVTDTSALPRAKKAGAMPVKNIPARSGEPFAEPFSSVGGSGNILGNNDFSAVETLSPQVIAHFGNRKFTVKDSLIPQGFVIKNNGIAPWTAGTFALESIVLPDGSKGNAVVWNMPDNKWGQAQFGTADTMDAAYFRQNKYFGGFWAKGNGTLTIRFEEVGKNGQTNRSDTAFLLTENWRFYRTPKPVTLKFRDSAGVRLDFLVYGQASVAMPEVAPMPAVDRSSELTFYIPFDRGVPQAAYSAGTVQPMGPSEELFPGVPGVDGKTDGAMRLTRKRRITEAGFLRVKMPLNFNNMQNILDPEAGTVELWMCPLPEMAVFQKWRPFNIFALGAGAGSWSKGNAPLSLKIDNASGEELKLVLTESRIFKEWPSLQRNANSESVRTCEYLLGDRRKFVGKWHHVALVYDKNGRTVYLDGKAVITAPAMKSPAIYNNSTLWLGGSHVASPSLISADIDEFKIYRGVRYTADFKPERTPLDFKSAAAAAAPGKPGKPGFTVGKPQAGKDKKSVIFPVSCGSISGELEIAAADGAPLIFSSKNAAMTIVAKHDPELPLLALDDLRLADGRAEAVIGKNGTVVCWQVDNKGETVQITMELDKKAGDWRTFIEGRVFFRRTDRQAWQKHFDGYGVRPVLTPFREFAFDKLIGAMPMSAAWNNAGGIALALTPDSFTSYLSRGMSDPETLAMAIRTVLDKGDRIKFTFELYPFSGKYGENAAVDAYHLRHRDIFARRQDVDPRLYSGPAVPTPWQTPAYRLRKDEYSHQEINRRARCQWSWVYKSGIATGNWAPDPEMLDNFAMLNRYEVANLNYHGKDVTVKKGEAYNSGSMNSGIQAAPYISQWLEARMVPYFRNSVLEGIEIPSGVDFKNGYWWPPIVDYMALQSGTEYGKWLRKQIAIMLDYPSINSFSHDEFVGDYRFRKETDLGGIRAFDRDGMYVHNLTAMGLFARDVNNMPNRTAYRSEIISNARIMNSGFPAMFYTVNNIYERTMHWAIQDWSTLRQHSRIMGEKPNSFWIEGFSPIIGNYFDADKDDIRLLKYMFTAYYHQQFLVGILFNVNMHPGMLGFKEAVSGLDELRRMQALGYRQTAAFAPVDRRVPAARYGEAARGVIVLVNPSHEERQAGGTVDSDHLGALPLFGEHGKLLAVKNGTFGGTVPANMWRTIDMNAAVKTRSSLEYTSEYTANIDRRQLTLVMDAPAEISEAVFGLGAFEKLDSITLNGKSLAHRRTDSGIVVSDLKLAKGDKLFFSTCDVRWLSGADAVTASPFLTGKKLVIMGNGGRAAAEAGRLREYFRFWTQNQPDMETFSAPIVTQAQEASVIVCYREEGEPGILKQGNTVFITGKGQQLQEMNDLFMTALDKVYVYYGIFGDQMATKMWDHVSTSEQRKLQEKCNAVKNLLSVEAVTPGFIEYIRENKTDTAAGF